MKRDDLNLLKDPSAELIGPYTFSSRGIEHDRGDRADSHWSGVCAAQGGFNPKSRELTPMRFVSAEVDVHEALDHITAAVEAGVVDRNRWASQLFADEDELEGFLEQLEAYDDCFRITDRWWTALAALANRGDEEGFISSAQVVDGLRESIGEGARRCVVLLQQAEYFAKHPLKKVRMTRLQSDALETHNDETRAQSHRASLKHDESFEFHFTQPYFFIRDKKLAARQVTADDLTDLTTKAKPSVATAAPAKGSRRTPKSS